MKASTFYWSTLKEAPADTELVSHAFMIRAGLINRLGSGLYTWMPMGLRVLRKIEAIIREEMQNIGAVELLMPCVQPAELWKETGRWDQFGEQMLKITDRHQRHFCFGPTHEEVVTDIVRREVQSYRQLPLVFFQIQTKFRDEIRPRFGVMRAREFLMKDAYSFHIDLASLEETYRAMRQAYCTIFSRLGLKYRVVQADSGAIGGAQSQEFHVLSEVGEDLLVYDALSDFSANREQAFLPTRAVTRPPPVQPMSQSSIHSGSVLQQLLSLSPRVIKAVVVCVDERFFCLLLRADHTLNEVKVGRIAALQGYRLATAAEITTHFHCEPEFVGPLHLPAHIGVFFDQDAFCLADFTCCGNRDGVYYSGVCFGRDIPEPAASVDIRYAQAGDVAVGCVGPLAVCRGIEVGHIFQLGEQYSTAMRCTVSDGRGAPTPVRMGCYGIGISRLVAAAIEQYHDQRGITWPAAISPFLCVLIILYQEKTEDAFCQGCALYEHMQREGIDVFLDDRLARAGTKFADADLVGITHQFVISPKTSVLCQVEYRLRHSAECRLMSFQDAVSFMQTQRSFT